MQEELLQFKIHNVWTLVDCPKEVRPIGTKWVLKNKKDERGIVIRNKARIVAQGHTQEEGIDYDEVFAPVTRIKAIRLFLAYASFIGFTVYQMDVKSAFIYGINDEEVGTIDQILFIKRQRGNFILLQVYVDDIIFGSSNPQLCREFEAFMHEKFQMSAMGELNLFLGLQVLQKEDGIFLSQDKPDIMFAVYACTKHQVTPKECHLHVVKRIFRYLKGHPKLGLWYPKESPFDLVTYLVSDYGGATQDRKSTTGGSASCCGQVLWIQNQLLDYGDCFEKKLISVDHIHTDENVTDLLTKPFDEGSWDNFPLLVFSLGFGLTFAGTSKYWGVLRILMISLRLILLSEHNIDFHPIVDFVEASHLRIETTETKILSTINGNLKTVFESSIRQNPKLNDEAGINSLPDAELFENLTLMGYNISPNQKFTFQKDESASHLRDVSQGEACPTVSSLDAEQDILQRQQSDMVSKFEAQEFKITMLKARVKLLEDREGRVAERSRDDALIKGRSLDEGEEVAEKGSNNTEEMINVLTSTDAAIVLLSGVAEVPTGSSSIPTDGSPAAGVPTGSDVVPTAGPIFATATVVTPYTRRKRKEKMTESKTPTKKKIQKQMDIYMARHLEEEMEREAQRMNEQIAKDAKIVRIYAEEELQIMIDGLDRSNETIAKYLQEYHQFATELPIERRIKLISDLVRYQDNYAKVHKYHTLQRKPRSKKQKKDYYMAVIKGHTGWKTKDFKGMSFKQIEAKFNTVWKQIKDFIPMGSKEETERFKRKGLRLEQVSEKKLKTSKEVLEEVKATEEVLEDKVKEMMQLVPVEENLMHAPVEWKMYDTCGVHHVTSKDKEIFMLVEKDYPLRKGLVIVMISYKLQVENYS
nr:hypothetical protein [Tanacetum cinerariifolium]